jgi:hypothetical protein
VKKKARQFHFCGFTLLLIKKNESQRLTAEISVFCTKSKHTYNSNLYDFKVATVLAMLVAVSLGQHHELPHYAPVEVEEYHHVSKAGRFWQINTFQHQMNSAGI